ncbi:hypothetical protein Airi02_091770 [Actinoallomurus iriomotensis]|uniref:Uncharacterized protein n=1 Tax=Actinoallomurus iriomotensis TaxID=478107 RepID=A0A9W6SCY3_9ACTN|nr:hypothetical protein Airi02_091770 [Actinoallomurus iriomotensis]
MASEIGATWRRPRHRRALRGMAVGHTLLAQRPAGAPDGVQDVRAVGRVAGVADWAGLGHRG